MITIRILTSDFHTFRPYVKQQQEFYKRGIKLVGKDESKYDITLIGHSLFQDKKIGSLEKSTEMGLNFLRKVEGPYILVDGQDSHSLIGSFEVFKESSALFMLKHSLLKDRNLYNDSYVGGRYYWGKSEQYGIKDQNYKPEDFNSYRDRILLSGTNWLGVPDIRWGDYSKIDKLFHVSGMFQYPHPDCQEFDLKPSQDFYYNKHREPVLKTLSEVEYIVAKLVKGRRVSKEQYNKYVQLSKLVLAPFGYGEMAPRDIESAAYGSILIKPDMSHVDTYPNVYKSKETYVPCKHDYSNLPDIIEYYCDNFENLQSYFVNNFRSEYDKLYTSTYLVDYTETLLKKQGILQ